MLCLRGARKHDFAKYNHIYEMKSNLCILNAETFLLRIEFVFVLVEFWKAHRRTEIMTNNPNFDFGAFYIYRLLAECNFEKSRKFCKKKKLILIWSKQYPEPKKITPLKKNEFVYSKIHYIAMQYVVLILKRFEECSSHLKYFIFLSIFL